MKKLLSGIIIMFTAQFCKAQNVGIGTTNPTAKLHVAGNVKIDSANTLEFGAGLASKEPNAGKIGYATFTPATLDIIGAGNSGTTRKIKFWSEGGATFNGGATFTGNVGIGTTTNSNILNVVGTANIDSLAVGTTTPSASFDVNGTALFRGNNINNFGSPVAAVEFFTGRTSAGALVAGQTTADIAFDYGGTGGGYRHFISTRHNTTANSATNGIDFYINNSGTASGSSLPGTGNVMEMSITAAGVGIGTAVISPNIELQVAGNTVLDGKTIMTDTLFVPHIYQEPSILATLLNGWVNNGGVVAPVSFYKDREERVYLAGTMRNGIFAANTTLFILPVGYRPAFSEFFSVHNNNTSTQIRVDPNGVVSLWGPANNNTGLCVSSISFRAEN
jgi:hypothetical protein